MSVYALAATMAVAGLLVAVFIGPLLSEALHYDMKVLWCVALFLWVLLALLEGYVPGSLYMVGLDDEILLTKALYVILGGIVWTLLMVPLLRRAYRYLKLHS